MENEKLSLKEIMMIWEINRLEISKISDILTIEHVNDQFYRRILIKNTISIIETHLYILRELVKYLIVDQKVKNTLSAEELWALHGKTVDIGSNGKVTSTHKFFRFESSLKFTFHIASKLLSTQIPDYSNECYQDLKKLVDRRNDLTHPKSSAKLMVSDEEVKKMVYTSKWFFEQSNIITQKFIDIQESKNN